MPFDSTLQDPISLYLLKASNLVDQRGLAKFTQEDREGRVCIHGAISIVVTHFPGRSNDSIVEKIVWRFHQYMQSIEIKSKYPAYAWWNNKPERTKEEVVKVLREAAYYRS